jgi:hypothetical protein
VLNYFNFYLNFYYCLIKFHGLTPMTMILPIFSIINDQINV